MSKRYKPTPKFKVLTPKYWNLIFWIALFSTPIIAAVAMFFQGFWQGLLMIREAIKEYDFN